MRVIRKMPSRFKKSNSVLESSGILVIGATATQS